MREFDSHPRLQLSRPFKPTKLDHLSLLTRRVAQTCCSLHVCGKSEKVKVQN